MFEKNISVIVPCFNEANTIHANLGTIRAYLEENFREFEIIAVNDGSFDATLAQLEQARNDFGIRIINLPYNLGKGSAVKTGVMEASYTSILFLDADLAIPIEELSKFIPELDKGADVVIASRFVPGLKIVKPVLWYRKIMENVFRLLRMLIINNYHVKDTQCGFKLFRASAAKEIFSMLTVHRFAFDSEIVYICGKYGYKIKELPITLQNPRESHIRIIRDPLNMLKDLIKIRLNDLEGRYDRK